jgi:hypothetical protein
MSLNNWIRPTWSTARTEREWATKTPINEAMAAQPYVMRCENPETPGVFHSAVQRMRVSAAGIPMKINRLAKSDESICTSG